MNRAARPAPGLLTGLVAALWTFGAITSTAAEKLDAFAANRLLGRGLNLGNALEAPREGEWGLTLKAEYFEAIQQAGFNSVRIPIRWSAHAETSSPFRIQSDFFQRIDWVVDQALSRGLAIVINVQHYNELFDDPDAHAPRLKELWRQIAQHYRNRPGELFFELLNEPHGKLNPARWQEMVADLLGAVRESNPDRTVIVGPGNWNNLDSLPQLTLPPDDLHLIATFHYYSPMEFTHQGANWVNGSEKWKGTRWSGTPTQLESLRNDFARAAAWARNNRRPLFLGEFGSYSAADMDSRVSWTRAVVSEAGKHGMPWAYWEFGAGFGVYDPRTGKWREPLLEALVPKRK